MRRIPALFGAAALALAPAVAAAQTKVSNLPAATAVSSSDVFPASQGCSGAPPAAGCTTTAGVTGLQLKTFAQSGLSASSLSNGTTGAGAVVLATSPSLTTPALGVATLTTFAGLHSVSSITAGATAQIGTGGTAACASSRVCDSLSGEVTVTTGTGTLAAGTILTVNFADTRTTAPNCVVSNFHNGSSSSNAPNPSSTTSTLAVGSSAALAASTTYTVDYVCGGK